MSLDPLNPVAPQPQVPVDPPGDPAQPSVFDALTNLLPVSLRPYAKAVYPFVLTIILTVAQAIINKDVLDTNTLVTAVVGLVTTLAAFVPPNKPYVRPEA